MDPKITPFQQPTEGADDVENLKIEPNEKQLGFLEQLLDTGLYGATIEEVLMRLVDAKLIEIFAPIGNAPYKK